MKSFKNRYLPLLGLVVVLAAFPFMGLMAGAEEIKGQAEAERRSRDIDEARSAFRGPADIYLVAKGPDQPAFVGAKFAGLFRVATELYFYIELSDGSTLRLPPSQVLMVKIKQAN
jgi:hypothetical protein